MDIATYRIDMRPETQQEILDKYNTAINHATNLAGCMIRDLSEQSEQCRYKPLKDAINYLIMFYNDSLKGSVNTAVHEWRESDASVCKILRKTGNTDDDALREGMEFEVKLYESAGSLFIKKHDMLTHPMTGGNFGPKQMQECADIVKSFLNKYDELRSGTIQEFDEGAANNAIYAAVKVLIVDTLKQVMEAFSGAREQFDDLCEDLGAIVPDVERGITDTAGSFTSRIRYDKTHINGR